MSKSKLSLICIVILLAMPLMALGAAKGTAPTISSISPATATAGGAGFVLTVTGSNFTFGSVVRWNGSNLTTTYVSASQLQAPISSALISAAGTAQITVFTSGRGGGTSNGVAFTVAAGAAASTQSTSPLAITTTSVPAGTLGTAYSATLAGSGGTSPYAWSISGGALPSGLALSAAGAILGTPTTSGTYSFTAQLADSASHTAAQAYSLAISTAPLAIVTTSVPAATAGTAYSAALSASGGAPPHGWSISGGALPPGLSMSSSGAISGTPAASGSYSFTAQATDAASHTASYTYGLTVAAGAAPTAPLFQSGFETALPSGFGSYWKAPDVSLNFNPLYIHSGSYSAQINYHICGIPNPPTLSYTPGGSLPQTTYYVKVTGVLGGETLPSTEVSLTVPAGNVLVVTLPAAQPDLTGANVYVGTAPRGETLQNVTPLAQATTWTEPATGLVTGTAPPAAFAAACGGWSQDSNRNIGIALSQALNQFYARGYVYFKSPEADATQYAIVGRKLMWFTDTGSSGDQNGNFQILVSSGNDSNGVFASSQHLTVGLQYYPSGACPGSQQVLWSSPNLIGYDVWNALELYVQLNTPGQSDGVMTVWLNGTQLWTSSALNIRATCSTGINAFWVGDQANRHNYDTVHEYRFWDDVALSTSYIP